MIKKIARSIREFKKPTILSIIFISFEVIMECLIPMFMKFLIDSMEIGETNKVTLYSLVLVGMAFASLAFGSLSGKFAAQASSGFAKNLRRDLYEKISSFSFSNIDKFSSSSLVTRLTTDVSSVQMAFMMIIRAAIRSPFMLTFSIIMSFITASSLAWVFIVVTPFLVIGLGLIGYKAIPTFRRIFKKYDKMNESVQENIAGIRTVKSFVREDFERQKFNKASKEVRDDFTKAERIIAWNSPLMQFAIYSLNILIIFLGATMIIKGASVDIDGTIIYGQLSKGTLSGLLVYGIQILMSLMMLSMVFVMLTMSIEAARRISEVFDEVPDIKDPENPVFEVKDGSIDFENVNFKYSKEAQNYALSNINLHIKSGETVGILGITGSSKTTLVNLISRLYDVTEGEVKVGGVNVKDYDLKVLRDQVSVVLQKNLLFSGTIADNLRWGNENATQEDLERACKISCADEFVETLPKKYETFIEQGGTNVSGGQKQRLCIARALLKNPKILILDDSTSAVDTKTDAKIRDGFKNYIPETTKIIIAQRVASVQDADKIIMMNNGTIEAIGKHEELLKTNEDYRQTYYSQNKVKEEM